ncbi:Type IV leader peptidase family protein [Pseudobutyrivibrio xylanivorans]|uniref:Type IV leader peptidase family protein n=1 Tax=Pseudobutyrivibrio xylanivorans TaxID=185007 RepID=A0A1G5RY62_PSEXY|nr:Type IV leader peptidase family protein [Pseudobutyrivibrio xylanivorans]
MANLFDARDYKVPNELIILGYAAGLFLNIQNFQLIGVVLFIIKAALPILILYLLYRVKGIGSGDIKLFSVMSTLVGFEYTTDVMVASVMLAGIAVLGLFLYEKGINLKRRLHYSFYITAAFFLLQIIND